MIVPTVIAMAAPTAVRITHWIASPRSGSSARTRSRTAVNRVSPSASSGKTRASPRAVVLVKWMSMLASLLEGSRGEHFRHGRVAEEHDEAEAEHHLGDEHRLRTFVRATLRVAEFPVTERRCLRAQAGLRLSSGGIHQRKSGRGVDEVG